MSLTQSQPEVSLIVPTYNGERFLRECFDSILAQNSTDVEILVADDGSTDRTLEIINNYAAKDSRIRWWQNPRNLGQTENHNACLRAARGEFIKFVHQDDKLLAPDAIRKLATALDENPTATLAGSASDVIDERSRLVERRRPFKTGVWDGREIVRATFEAVGNPIGEPSVVMFRKAQAGDGFSRGYRQLWDLEMWYRLLEQGRFVYFAEPLCAFRQHSAQQSLANHRSGIGPDEMLRLLETYYAKPWLHEMASQRMLINQSRFLKKNLRPFGRRAEVLLAEMKSRIQPASYPLFWLERKARHPIAKMKKAAARKAGQRS